MPSSIINSDDGVSSGSAGIKTTGGDDGVLKLQTNGVDAVTVNASQVASFANNFGTVAGLPSYQCRAWVNFDGTGTVAIRASGNVSSITDNGTGNYTVNFTTAMQDENYSVSGAAGQSAASVSLSAKDYAVSSVAVVLDNTRTGSRIDDANVSVNIFR